MTMKTRFFLLQLLLLVMFPVLLHAQKWTSVDDSTLVEHERIRRSDYKVYISTDRHRKDWKEIKVYGALVSNIEHRAKNSEDTLGTERTLSGFALFQHSFKKPVHVRVHRQGTPFGQVEIRPSQFNIPHERIDSRTIEFTIKSPEQRVSVEFDNDRDHNLFIIPDRPLPAKSSQTAGHFRYYGPGEHEAGFIRLNSNDTLFIDAGAVVYGQIEAFNAHHITIMGQGILCGSKTVHDFIRRKSMIYMHHCSNVHVEGVMFRGSPSWTLNFSLCDSVLLDNIKQICWARNSDGIDLLNSTHVTIRNSFLRNYDDNISLKNFPVRDNPKASLHHVLMENCILWADCGHNLLVGPESTPEGYMSDITFRNIQILEGRESAYPWRGALAVMVSDEGAFRNVLFEDINLDGIRGGQLLSVDFCSYVSRGRQAADITFRNISSHNCRHDYVSDIHGLDANHKVEGIRLDNIRVNGIRLTKENLPDYLNVNAFVEGFSLR